VSESPPRYVAHPETLIHFRCPHVGCARWWSIADAPLNRIYFCPWCGQQLEPPESAGTAAEDLAPRPYYAIIERSRNPEVVARFAFGPAEKIKRGIGDPHFPALLFTLADLGVISSDSPRVICPTCSQVVTPISGAADVPR
jgi:predicted RNA-binding Zn-ribbon protein involved in translation (DUF1610 family)